MLEQASNLLYNWNLAFEFGWYLVVKCIPLCCQCSEPGFFPGKESACLWSWALNAGYLTPCKYLCINHGTAKSTGAGSCPSTVTPKKTIGHWGHSCCQSIPRFEVRLSYFFPPGLGFAWDIYFHPCLPCSNQRFAGEHTLSHIHISE